MLAEVVARRSSTDVVSGEYVIEKLSNLKLGRQ